MRTIGYIASGVIVGSSLMIASSAIAGGFAIREQSTTGLGVAFADSAAGSDLSSMYWNPAAVTAVDGMNTLSSYSAILPDVDITMNDPTEVSTNKDDLGLLAASYFNYQLNSQLYVGMSINAPLGLTTTADPKVWQGEEHFQKSEMLTMNVAPTVGYKITPQITVAAGLQVQYMKVRLQSKHLADPTFTHDTITKGDDIAMGFTAGVLVEPMSGTKVGIGYRSSIKHKLKGELFGLAGPTDHKLISAKFATPEMVTASIRQQVTPGLALMANYEWSNWSRLDKFDLVNLADGSSAGGTTYNWEDAWYASVGAEMMLSSDITGRVGAAYEKTPVTAEHLNAALPDSDRIWVSLGGSYKWSEATTIDIGYAHIFFKDTDINIADEAIASFGGAIRAGIAADVDNRVDIISIGMRHKW